MLPGTIFYCWLIVIQSGWKLNLPCSSAAHVVYGLRQIFSTWGLPVEMVTDNGPLRSPLYHPKSNGLADKTVQTTKSTLQKDIIEPCMNHFELQKIIDTFLFKYRNRYWISCVHHLNGTVRKQLTCRKAIFSTRRRKYGCAWTNLQNGHWQSGRHRFMLFVLSIFFVISSILN